MPTLSPAEIATFIEGGFVRIDDAFTRDTADAARLILWRATGCDPDDPATWTRPVVRLGFHAEQPFVDAVNTERLRSAFDQLVGAGRWIPRADLGTFPVRFPSTEEPGDAGWHVDASFPGADPADYLNYRINVRSTGRALLMLFLFSDVGEHDAPTRIRRGSHHHVARMLAPAGDAGLSFMELAAQLEPTATCPTELAVGPAGTVYLCHPFVVHAAQPHHGRVPRFMAQPPLHASRRVRDDDAEFPVEQAIRRALDHQRRS